MIELRDLTVGYDGKHVLEGVTLSPKPGRVTALLGPNGCGKSTLLRTVLGLQPKLGGEILVDGAPAESLSPRQLARKAAYLPQSRSAPNIPAARMVLYSRAPYTGYLNRSREEDRAAAQRALEQAGGAELAHRPVSTLSGGERQKVYLAMAMAQDTPNVFMDEPTTYLDVAHQLRTMEMARAMAVAGKAVVMVLHDLPLALPAADDLAVFGTGRLLMAGETEEVFESGILNEVFGVTLRRLQTEHGWRYYYE